MADPTLLFIAQLALTAGSVIYQRKRAKKFAARAAAEADKQKGFQIVTNESVSALPVVYGRAKVGGVRVFHKVSDNYVYTSSANEFLGYGDERAPSYEFSTPVTGVYIGRIDGDNEYNQFITLSTTATVTSTSISFTLSSGSIDSNLLSQVAPGNTITVSIWNGQFPYKITSYASNTLVLEKPEVERRKYTPSLNSDVTGTKAEFLFVQQAICHGGVNRAIWCDVDDKDFLDDSFKGNHRLHFYPDGGPDGMASSNGIPAPGETNDFTGVCYASMVFRLDRDDPAYSGVPEVKWYIEGQKIRGIGGTEGARTYVGAKSYSNNPALVLLDYLTNTEYGKGIPVEKIDLDSFVKAQTICDTIVHDEVEVQPVPLNGKYWENAGFATREVKLYECNIVLDTSQPIRDNVELILETMGEAELVWSGGKYKLQLDYPEPPFDPPFGEFWYLPIIQGELTDEDLVRTENLSISWPTTQQRANYCTVKFLNESKNFEEDSVSWPRKIPKPGDPDVYGTYLTEDSNIPLEKEIFLTGCTDEYHALAYAEQLVRQSRDAVVYVLHVQPKWSGLEPGDKIRLVSQVLDIPGEILKVEEVKVAADGTAEIQFVKYDPRHFAWNAKDNEIVPIRTLYNTELVQASNLVFTKNITPSYSGKLTWSPAADARVMEYIVLGTTKHQYELGFDTQWEELGRVRVPQSSNTPITNPYQFLTPLADPNHYTVAVVSSDGKGKIAPRVSYTTGSRWPTLTVDLTLGQPTNLAFTTVIQRPYTSGTLTWDPPAAEPRVRYYRVMFTTDLLVDIDAETVWEEVAITQDAVFYTPIVEAGTYTLAVASVDANGKNSPQSGWPIIAATIASSTDNVEDIVITGPRVFITPANSDTPAPANITLRADIKNIINPVYEWRIDGIIQNTGITSTSTYSEIVIPSFLPTASKRVRCDVDGDGGVSLFDEETIFSLKEGSGTLMAGLVPTFENIICDADGTINPGSQLPIAAEMIVMIGTQDITTGNGVVYSVVSQSGFNGSASINASTGIISITEMNADIGAARFRATFGTAFVEQEFKAYKIRNGNNGANAQSLTLQADRFYFIYDSPTATTSSLGPITFTAVLKNTTGTVTFTGQAYDANNNALGTIDLTETSATTATMSHTQFNAQSPTGVETKYVVVTASLGDLSDTFAIARGNDGSDGLTLYLDNPSHPIQTDEGGNGGDYTYAKTKVQVFEGTIDVTNLWTFARLDFDTVSSINGVSGPVSGTSTVEVVVTDLVTDSGRVRITATRSGYPTLIGYFNLVKNRAGFDGTNAQTLRLSATGIAFLYDSLDDTTSDSPTITLTANLQNLSGTVDFTATAYDSANVSLGAITLTETSPTATLSSTQFLQYGVNTRYVKVTATLGDFTDTMSIYRGVIGSNVLNMWLSNEAHVISTNAEGTSGDFNDANTIVKIYEGITDVTEFWSISRADTNCTSLINGVSGPITGTPDVEVDVIAMSADNAIVTISATRSGYDPLEKIFSLAKSKQGAGAQLYYLTPTGLLFVYEAEDSTVSDSPTITITATSVGIIGAGTSWSATAYNGAGSSLGSVTIGTSGETATITAAQFKSQGVATKYVVITGTRGSFSDSVTIYSTFNGSQTPQLGFDNTNITVPTDSEGNNGLYANANTNAYVELNGAVVNTDYTFSITPGTGITANINSSGTTAGPGVATILINVTNTTVDIGTISVTATYGSITLNRTLTVVKQKDGSTGATLAAYWDPREIIYLPVDAAGNVIDYTNAWSDLKIVRNNTNEVSSWTLSKVDTNLVSSLNTGTGRVSITNFTGGSNSISFGAQYSNSVLNFNTGSRSIYHVNGRFILFNYANGSAATTTDWENFTAITLYSNTDATNMAANPNGTVIAPIDNNGTTLYKYSTDSGATWSDSNMPVAANYRCAVWAGTRFIVSRYNNTTGYVSTNGVSGWSTVTLPASGTSSFYFCYNRNNGVLLFHNGETALYRSTDAGSTWSSNLISNFTAVQPLGSTPNQYIQSYMTVFNGHFVAFLQNASNKVVISPDGISWSAVTLPGNLTAATRRYVYNNILYVYGGNGFATTNLLNWSSVSGFGLDGNSSPNSIMGYPMNVTFVPQWHVSANHPTNNLIKGTLSTIGSPDEGQVVITATKSGEADITKTLIVRKAPYTPDVYTLAAAPASIALPSTSDGVVTSFSNSTINIAVLKNGIGDTSNWTIATTTSHAGLTVSSSSSSTFTITGFSTAAGNSGTINIKASKAGAIDLYVSVSVSKTLGSTPSGVLSGTSVGTFFTTESSLTLRFATDGTVKIKKGTGSFVTALNWYTPTTTNIGNTHWVKVTTTGDALTSGTTGSYLQLNSDRDFELSRNTTGISTTQLRVYFATSSTGANATLSLGELEVDYTA